jgi:hypothetical protein
MLPAPPPTPLLESGFWQRIAFGNPDSLVPGSEATRALYLVSDKLAIPIVEGETIDTLRAGELRKLLRERFGPALAEQAIAALWRSAPASPAGPTPNQDQSQLYSGPWPITRAQPRWVAELNEPGGAERDWLMENGMWCGN